MNVSLPEETARLCRRTGRRRALRLVQRVRPRAHPTRPGPPTTAQRSCSTAPSLRRDRSPTTRSSPRCAATSTRLAETRWPSRSGCVVSPPTTSRPPLDHYLDEAGKDAGWSVYRCRRAGPPTDRTPSAQRIAAVLLRARHPRAARDGRWRGSRTSSSTSSGNERSTSGASCTPAATSRRPSPTSTSSDATSAACRRSSG